MSSGREPTIRRVIAAPSRELPIGEPVLYWRAGEERRAVVGLSWYDTKTVGSRVLAAYRQQWALQSLGSVRLAEPGACEFLHLRGGHTVGLARPWVISRPLHGTSPVLVAHEIGAHLVDPLVAASAEDASAYLAESPPALRAPSNKRSWFVGEFGESRAHLMWTE